MAAAVASCCLQRASNLTKQKLIASESEREVIKVMFYKPSAVASLSTCSK